MAYQAMLAVMKFSITETQMSHVLHLHCYGCSVTTSGGATPIGCSTHTLGRQGSFFDTFQCHYTLNSVTGSGHVKYIASPFFDLYHVIYMLMGSPGILHGHSL